MCETCCMCNIPKFDLPSDHGIVMNADQEKRYPNLLGHAEQIARDKYLLPKANLRSTPATSATGHKAISAGRVPGRPRGQRRSIGRAATSIGRFGLESLA